MGSGAKPCFLEPPQNDPTQAQVRPTKSPLPPSHREGPWFHGHWGPWWSWAAGLNAQRRHVPIKRRCFPGITKPTVLYVEMQGEAAGVRPPGGLRPGYQSKEERVFHSPASLPTCTGRPVPGNDLLVCPPNPAATCGLPRKQPSVPARPQCCSSGLAGSTETPGIYKEPGSCV